MAQQSITKMVTNSRFGLAAILQVTSTSDKIRNFEKCSELIQKAVTRGAEIVFLPEAFDFIGDNADQTRSLSESLSGPTISKYRSLARDSKTWLSLGGFHEMPSTEEGKIFNTHVIIDNDGEIRAKYSKTHLFDVDIPGKVRIKESDYVRAGPEIVDPVNTPVGRVGLGICYDLRFPEMSLSLARRGADILTFPSAFTVPTGLAHWESLLRSRAIETQCYVIASAQTGQHNQKRSSYGHSVIIDPWGTIVAQCSEGEGIALAQIDHDYLEKVRKNLPVWNHRRPDLYALATPGEYSPIDLEKVHQFGRVTITGSCLVLRTPLTFVSVNRKPVVPGHMLVIPNRHVKKLSDLDAQEVADLFIVVQKVQRLVESVFGTTSSTVAIQDGPDAGQTIDHVHVHVMPRKPDDFARNDDVYDRLEKHDKGEVEWREQEEMESEAEMLRAKWRELNLG